MLLLQPKLEEMLLQQLPCLSVEDPPALKPNSHFIQALESVMSLPEALRRCLLQGQDSAH